MALRLPNELLIASLRCIREETTGGQDNIFTLKQKRYDYGSSRWRWVITTSPLTRSSSEKVTGFFGRVKNQTILFGHPNFKSYDFEWIGRTTRSDTQTGNPVTQSRVQSGNKMIVRGLLEGQNLVGGTYFHILGTDNRQYLYQITKTVTAISDRFGLVGATATIELFPSIRSEIAVGQWLRFHDVLGEHYLLTPPETFIYNNNGFLQPFTFELVSI